MDDFYQTQLDAVSIIIDGLKDLLENLSSLALDNDEDELSDNILAVKKSLRVVQSEINGIDKTS